MHIAPANVINHQVVLKRVTLPEGVLITALPREAEASIRLSRSEGADVFAALDEGDREAGTASQVVLERLRKCGLF